MLVPNYMQTWGLARAFGATVRGVARWSKTRGRRAGASTSTALERARHRRGRKLIVICNPNNPTGARLDRRGSRRHRRDRRSRTAPGSCPTRSIAAPSSTASRRRRCGAAASAPSSPADCRRPTGCPGCASAGLSARPPLVGVALVVSRLHHHRAGRAERPPGAGRAGARAPEGPARTHARHPARQLAAARGLAARSR